MKSPFAEIGRETRELSRAIATAMRLEKSIARRWSKLLLTDFTMIRAMMQELAKPNNSLADLTRYAKALYLLQNRRISPTVEGTQ